ncbi:MAG: glycosyltransferase [Zoogloea oleivorans]|jgi:glycosyltransferase involved in cell wall biosynthesis|uniref:glycosyltransferase n=1 Tax=Zoogloea oleivorans TaxID=1552750 RepID=UPI002A361712|nr:glycosyltransferase [Zoogloea oleivorans]MDY0038226.1 glycosyltransferase [Zoogloea oleivorans]
MKSFSILFLTTVLPGRRYGCTGGEAVTVHVIKALRDLGHSVHVLGYGRPNALPAEGERLAECRPIETRDAPVRAGLWFASALLRGQPYSMEKYTGHTYRDALALALRQRCWDRVILDHAQTAWLLPLLSGQRIIHLSHNNEAGLYAERAANGNLLRRLIFGREAHLIYRAEKALARATQSVWTLTQANAEYFARLGAESVAVLPIPPMSLPASFHPGKPEYDIGLLGTWSWGPNRSGLDWFCNEVLPLLPSKLKIAIAGVGAEHLNGRFPNLSILGRVLDAAEFLGKARCIAVPSVAGDGLQIKTLDAIAIGRPVVATRHALRGIDDVPARVRIADTPQTFGAALSEAVANTWSPVRDAWAAQRQERFSYVLKDVLA